MKQLASFTRMIKYLLFLFDFFKTHAGLGLKNHIKQFFYTIFATHLLSVQKGFEMFLRQQ